MWCGSTLIINSGDNWGRNPSSGGEMGLREDEAAIKAWMKRCKTIRPERMGGKGGRRGVTTPGKWAKDRDREIDGRGIEWKEGMEREGESAMSALHQKLCQSFTTTDQPHPTYPVPPPPPNTPPPLLHSLFNSHINSTSFNRQPGVSSTECQSSVQGDRRVNEGGEGARAGTEGGERREEGGGRREEGVENCLACSEAFFFFFFFNLKVLPNMTRSFPF